MDTQHDSHKDSTATHTYHCLCSHLLFASTSPLSSLDRRAEGSLDRAYILPLPPLPQVDTGSDAEFEDHDDDGDTALKARAKVTKAGEGKDYALLLSVVLDRKPLLVTRSDGFEKRWLQRCGRCRTTVGYQLDKGQFGGSDMEGSGRREDVIYLLPGGFMSTEDMTRGVMPDEREIQSVRA